MRKDTATKGELLPGTLEMLIMKALERNEAAMHGYGIARYIAQVSEDALRVEEGSLYPALQRLELKGWVESNWAISDNNRRARFYKLTRSGRKQLHQELEQFERVLQGILLVMRPA